MPNICSSCKIQVNTADTFPGGTTLLSIDDRMAEEITMPVEVSGHYSEPINAVSSVPRGRGNRKMTITFSRIKDDHTSAQSAREYQMNHTEDITGLGLGGRLYGNIQFASNVALGTAGTVDFDSNRVRVVSVDVRVTGGTETTATYVLDWQMYEPPAI